LSGQGWLVLWAVILFAWRVPLMYRQSPGQDEDFYGVCGMAILRSGLPQIPYIPSRDATTIYYMADVALYTLPPLSFFWQAAVHLVLGDGIGPARAASALAGLAAALLVNQLALVWSGDRRAAFWATTFYVLSRAFYFPATTARPDMLATALGLAALWAACRQRVLPNRRWRIASGVFAGLSTLAHPMGVVPCVHVGLWLVTRAAPWRSRLAAALDFVAAVLATAALWLPLIVLHPDLFRTQFGGILLLGGGAFRSLTAPWSVLEFHARLVWEHFNPIQSSLCVIGLVWAARQARKGADSRELFFHLLTGLVLLVGFMGRHPTKGYYAYPAALASVGVGLVASAIAGRIDAWALRRDRKALAAPLVVTVALVGAMVPGAGVQTLVAHARHWDNPHYDGRRFAEQLLADVPSDQMAAVDGYFTLYFWLAGKPVVDAIVIPLYFDVRTTPFEYLILGRVGLEQVKPHIDGIEFVRSYGDQADPFSHYAELYRLRERR
jgi:4-amino-4-deoxy-L-arabinose transferase-like glycosyltransferase